MLKRGLWPTYDHHDRRIDGVIPVVERAKIPLFRSLAGIKITNRINLGFKTARMIICSGEFYEIWAEKDDTGRAPHLSDSFGSSAGSNQALASRYKINHCSDDT